MSEFGRTARENGNRGTDHGHANVMFVLGGPVKGGKVYGRWPGLDQSQLYEGRDLALTTDFRQVIGEAVVRHMGNKNLATVFPGFENQPANMLRRRLRSGPHSELARLLFSASIRFMKNSSRLFPSVARNFTRSSSGLPRIGRLMQHPMIELQPSQVTITKEAQGRMGGSLDEHDDLGTMGAAVSRVATPLNARRRVFQPTAGRRLNPVRSRNELRVRR